MAADNRSARVALVAFAATTFLYLRRRRRSDQRGGKLGSSIPEQLTGRVGSRGVAALGPAIPYLDAFLKCLFDACDPVSNPRGHIALCMAENKLVTEVLAQRLMSPGTRHRHSPTQLSTRTMDSWDCHKLEKRWHISWRESFLALPRKA